MESPRPPGPRPPSLSLRGPEGHLVDSCNFRHARTCTRLKPSVVARKAGTRPPRPLGQAEGALGVLLEPALCQWSVCIPGGRQAVTACSGTSHGAGWAGIGDRKGCEAGVQWARGGLLQDRTSEPGGGRQETRGPGKRGPRKAVPPRRCAGAASQEQVAGRRWPCTLRRTRSGPAGPHRHCHLHAGGTHTHSFFL